MRVWKSLLGPFALAAGLALGVAGVANAAVLNWEGTELLVWGAFPSGKFEGGGVATINGSSGVIPAHVNTLRFEASRGGISGTVTKLVSDPDVNAAGIAALVYEGVGGLTGTWSGLSGGAASTSTGGGTLPLRGLVRICFLDATCPLSLPLPLSQPTTENGIPGTGIKGIGIGGLIADGYAGIRISVRAAPWTIKAATVLDQITLPNQQRILTPLTAKGWAHAPASTTTSTAQPSGVVQLVTPNQVVAIASGTAGSLDKVGSFAIVAIRFIPEPGLLLLLGSGVAGLALLGRRRAWKHPG